ncbi:hypothetical protein D915_003971 [Fasciola hepatica]|uniref:HEAT repeat protein n=1 Tax=Fasciola hepatica TaxID=6192 RepID=A0A4E0S216_FASHE|nr:hypothetical protein D915_003971 [Fasciola hepatica]
MADVISRIAPTTNSVALLQLLPPVAYRDIPSASGDLSVNQTGTESLVPRLPAVLQSGSAEVVEALTMTQQLLLASQLIGTLVESKLWWPLMKSCLERCTESVAPSSLAGHLFLLAGLIRGSSIVQLAMPELGAKNASDSNKVTATMLYDIVQYLAQDDLLAVISFGSKAALLECILVVIRRLEECVVNLQSSSANRETNESTPGNLESVGTEVNRNASTVLLLNTQLQSNLYVILLALGAVWADGDSAGTDFGTALIQLTDNGMRRLAACARDQAQVRADESNKEQTTAPAPTPSAIATTATTTSDNLRTWQTNLLAPASASDIDQLHNKYIFPLFQRLDADCTRSGSWHPRSVGLAIFSRCVQLAGPALLLSTVGSDSAESLSPLSSNTCLSVALQLLERGCRLDRKPGCDAEKAPGGTDPLTMASEAELRLRGLMLLTRLTDNTAVRNTLASPDYLSRCLTRLVLPACVWRAGRTAEAMRKAATTCLVALIAAATTIYDIDEASVDARTEDEVRLDAWLSDRSEPIRRLLGPKTEKLKRDNRTPRTSTLPKLTAAVLSKLLSRIGGLLEDDLEATRRMACLNVTLLFNGFLLPCAGAEEGSSDNSLFLASSTWLMPFKESDSSSTASPANESKPANVSCPLPNSFGDQVYRFYPNLIKRLNDAKDEIRLLVTESLNAWLRVVRPMLVCDQSPENSTAHRARLNPVHSAIIEDFLNGLLPHLDDLDDQIRAAVARVFARLCQFAPELCGRILHGARGRQRSPEFCDLLLQVVCND